MTKIIEKRRDSMTKIIEKKRTRSRQSVTKIIEKRKRKSRRSTGKTRSKTGLLMTESKLFRNPTSGVGVLDAHHATGYFINTKS